MGKKEFKEAKYEEKIRTVRLRGKLERVRIFMFTVNNWVIGIGLIILEIYRIIDPGVTDGTKIDEVFSRVGVMFGMGLALLSGKGLLQLVANTGTSILESCIDFLNKLKKK